MTDPLTKLKKILKENSARRLDAMLISSISNIVYLTGYAGFSKEEREAFLFVTKNAQYILTDGRYTQAVKTLISDFKLIEITSENPIKKILKNLKTQHKVKKLGFEGHNISFLEHKKLLTRFDDSNHQSLSSLRSIKSFKEISLIEKACQLGDKTFDYILKKIRLGVSEKELAFEIEFFIKKNGADISFKPIVAFGANSAIPHHQVTNNQLTNNQIVLLDFGVKLNNYCSDMTRTVFFGRPTPKQKKMYKTVFDAQQKAIEHLSHYIPRVGPLGGSDPQAKEVDKVAREYITSKGYPTIPHSVGHGIGIDVHEVPHLSPNSKNILKTGMVFSIEPGIYVPNFGGVRIEDLAVLEQSGARLLTHSSKALIQIH